MGPDLDLRRALRPVVNFRLHLSADGKRRGVPERLNDFIPPKSLSSDDPRWSSTS